MASSQYIAVLRGTSMERIKTASQKLAERFEGVEVPELEKVSGRNDPDLKFAQQLDLLAGVLEQVVSSSGLMQTSNANQVAELETKLKANDKALKDIQDGADSIIKDHQGYIQKLEKDYADAQTQLLDMANKLEAANKANQGQGQAKGGK